jgi:superkiller protein 3
MAIRPKIAARKRAPSLPRNESQSAGVFSGTAQGGPARSKRAPVLAEELFARGNLYIQSQVWEEAAREFRNAIKMEPDYPEAFNNLGLCLLYGGQAQEAVTAFQSALKLFPGWALAEANLGLTLQRMQQHKDAAGYYLSSLQKNNQQPTVWMAYGDCHSALGSPDQALYAYQQAVTLSPKYDMAYVRMGLLQARRNNLNEAEDALARAVAIEPNNPDAAAVLGAISARKGDIARARDYFNQVEDLDPVPSTAARGLNRLAVFQRGMLNGMNEWKRSVPQPQPLAVCYYNLGLAHMDAGNETAAKDAFQQASQAQPDWPEPLIWFGFFAALSGDAVSARQYWESAAAMLPNSGLLFEQLGYLAVAMGLQKEADTQFARALSLGRKIPESDLKPDSNAGPASQASSAQMYGVRQP